MTRLITVSFEVFVVGVIMNVFFFPSGSDNWLQVNSTTGPLNPLYYVICCLETIKFIIWGFSMKYQTCHSVISVSQTRSFLWSINNLIGWFKPQRVEPKLLFWPMAWKKTQRVNKKSSHIMYPHVFTSNRELASLLFGSAHLCDYAKVSSLFILLI